MGGGVGSYPLLSQAPTPVEVELGCDNCVMCENIGNTWRVLIAQTRERGPPSALAKIVTAQLQPQPNSTSTGVGA